MPFGLLSRVWSELALELLPLKIDGLNTSIMSSCNTTLSMKHLSSELLLCLVNLRKHMS